MQGRPSARPTSRRGTAAADGPGTREVILDASEILFAEQGLAGVGMREIAQAAGLTPASLYNHFRGKEALYEAVLERGVRPVFELLRDFATREPSIDATEEIVGAIMEHLAHTPLVPRLIQHEAASGGERLKRLAQHWIRPLIEQGMAEMRRDPNTPWTEDEFPLVISAWLHLIFGHFAMASLLGEVFGDDPLSPEALERQTRFLRKLARLMMRSPLALAQDSPTGRR